MWKKATMTTKAKRCNGDNIKFRDENNDKQHNSIATWNNNDNTCANH